ncbi:MAG: sigma-54 dependent transcriptional regulator [Desulfobacterales bacterium]|jgi:two-component system response regulator AtoC|nr:sigma-54 dependent transcriptional regulator [Desulfobacterales bacterium]
MGQNSSAGKRLLIVDDEENMRHMLATLLRNSGYRIETASDGVEALEKIGQNLHEFILCDLKMPRMSGIEFLKAGSEKLKESTVIVMSAYGTIDTALEAMKMGAYDFISKPFKTDEVLLALKKAEERENLKRENIVLKDRIEKISASYNFGNLMAKSKSMLSVFKIAEKASKYNTTVLITGESGTGKELVAKGIHFNSDRAKKAFIPVNCGGIPENLLESELFGYKKGAFTGADKDKIGLIEAADGGTLLLDEIGDMPQSLQVKLLRALQEREILPVGGTRGKKIDVRVIAATATNLAEAIENGTFREDLFYRLNVLPIHVPPLRDRTEDIPLLVQNFIQRFNRKLGTDIKGITPPAMAILLSYDWPGNVRQLENQIERAMVLTDQITLLPDHFPPELRRKRDEVSTDCFFGGYSVKTAQKMIEKQLITKALQHTGGNRTHAAALLEISHPSLLSKMKTYGIPL